MNLKIDIDINKIVDKVKNDKFGYFVANECKRLFDPYTPRNTGMLQNSAKISPFQIHYIQKYAARVYYGKNFNFRHVNPYSTYEWDVAAANAGQLSKLYRAVNAALQSNRI